MLQPFQPVLAFSFGLFLCGLLTSGTSASAQSIAPFQFPTPAAAAKAWTPGTASPAAQPIRTLTRFPAPLTTVPDRLYWDHAARHNLDRPGAFELDLSCSRPEAIRAIGLHFRTATGWYTGMIPVTRAGLQRLIVSKGDFSTEQKPKPWSEITGIRLSFWKEKAQAIDTEVIVHGLRAITPRIALYQATTSESVASERSVARRATERISGWLNQDYLTHAILTDETLTRNTLAHSQLLILPYNRSPGRRAVDAIRDFVGRGGKLVVFHDTSSTIADLLGVNIERLLETKIAGRWSAMTFDRNTFPWPDRIQNASWNLIRATPKNAATRILARWESADGKQPGDIAALQSARGVWFSQILRDGDARNKRRLLLAILGSHVPDTWRQAADARLATSPRRLGAHSLPDLQHRIRQYATASRSLKNVQPILDSLPAQLDNVRTSIQAGNYREAIQSGFRLEDNIQRAFAIAQSTEHAAPNELRGFWDQNGTGLYPNNWDRTCREIKAAGFNALFPNVLWGGKAHYPSKFVPASGTLDNLGNQLPALIAAARKHNIDVHLWKICWKVSTAPAPFFDKLKREGRLMRDKNGKTVPWLCPADSRNQELELNAILEAARLHKPAGIHLDYLRFPDRATSFSAAMDQRWKKISGGSPLTAADADTRKFQTLRATIITDFLTRVRHALRDVDPSIKLSVAVWPEYPGTIPAIGQDYGAWLRADLVDFLCPMDYTADPVQFDAWIRRQSALPGARGKIIPGIGAISNEADLAPDEIIQQINLVRKRNLPGFVLFKLNPTVAQQVLPFLAAGATKP